MFEKKVVGALRSPALVADLKKYKRQLIREKVTRGWLLLFVLALLALHYAPLFITPASPTNSDTADIISGGLETRQDALLAYDNHLSSFYALASALHLQRADLSTLSPHGQPSAASGDIVEWVAISTYRPFKPSIAVEGPVFAVTSPDKKSVFYGYPVASLEGSFKPQTILVGSSKTAGEFSVTGQSGSIVTSWDYAKAIDSCYKQPGESLSYLHCLNGVNLTTTTHVDNTTRNRDARFTKARPGDRLRYSLVIRNQNQDVVKITPEIYLGDIAQYTHLDNTHGGVYDSQQQRLRWPPVSVPAQTTQTYSFSTTVTSPLPLNPRGHHDLNSYDCRLTTFFGGNYTVLLLCPTPKVIEFLLNQPFSPLFATVLWSVLVINGVLLLRVFVFNKELTLILEEMRKL